MNVEQAFDYQAYMRVLQQELEQTQRFYKKCVEALDKVDNPKFRNLLFMKYFEGLTIEQIAEELNYSERQVVRLLKQAKAALYDTA